MTEQATNDFTRQQLQFLGNPLDFADGGRVAELLKPFSPDSIKPCPQAWLRLQPWAEQQWQVPPEMFDFQAHPLGCYLLAPIEQTRRMAEWLGALAYYPIIRVTLKGEILNALKHELPNCYPDVLRHARAFQKWQSSLSASVTDKTPVCTCVCNVSVCSTWNNSWNSEELNNCLLLSRQKYFISRKEQILIYL